MMVDDEEEMAMGLLVETCLEDGWHILLDAITIFDSILAWIFAFVVFLADNLMVRLCTSVSAACHEG
jgi:hypothetical protein